MTESRGDRIATWFWIFVFVGVPLIGLGIYLVTGDDPIGIFGDNCPQGYHEDVVGEDRFAGEQYGCVRD